LQELGLLLASDGAAGALPRLNAKFPTAALAELSVELKRWRDLDADAAKLERLIFPRELP
jgi:phosphohistidine phosphatase